MVENMDEIKLLLWRILYQGCDWPSLQDRIDAGDCDIEDEDDIRPYLIPSERLERIAANNQPPQEWYDSVEDQDE